MAAEHPQRGDPEIDEPLTLELAELWRKPEGAGRVDARLRFFSLVNSRLKSTVLVLLRRRFDWMSEADGEDCYSDGLESFLRRDERGGLDGVENPAGYIWTCALNAAKDLADLQNRRKEVPLSDRVPVSIDRDDGDDGPVPGAPRAVRLSEADRQTWVTEVVESLVDDVVVEPSWADRLIAASIVRLSPRLRRVAEHVRDFGPDYNASEAPHDLGMKPATYRGAKKRAFEKLKWLIPTVMVELGIVPQRAVTEDVLRARVEFPSDSDAGGDETPQGLE